MRLSRRSAMRLLTLFGLGTGILPSLTESRPAGISENTMKKLIRPGFAPTAARTNGSAQRRLASWIDRFVEETEGLESPEIYRRWAAIVGLGAVLQQKVWVQTSAPLYPNIYAFLVGPPG